MGLACCAKRSQADIAEHLFLTQATVSRHIRTLIANGLLVKKINPRSKRECILTITLKGRKEMARARDIVEQEMKNIVAPIRSADRMLLLKVFRSLLTTLQSLNQKLK
jgi:DNA-binding MarR family transcriptional regulator